MAIQPSTHATLSRKVRIDGAIGCTELFAALMKTTLKTPAPTDLKRQRLGGHQSFASLTRISHSLLRKNREKGLVPAVRRTNGRFSGKPPSPVVFQKPSFVEECPNHLD
jgi:hypothetical protein